MSKVRLGDLVFPVRTAGPGDGEPVVLLHGFPQSSAAWSPYLARLSAAGFRAVAFDQRGYAATARPTAVGQYAIDHLVADVLGVADSLGADRFHLVGHDWGGVVGWALAAAHPERLRSLTSVSTPHPRALVWSLWRSLQLARFWYVGFFQLPKVPERLLAARNGALLRRMLRHSGLPEGKVAPYVENMLQPGALGAAINYYRALRPGRSLAAGRITVPVLYVWGTNDIALGSVAAGATGKVVDAPYRFEVLQEASHWIPETRVEELSALVLDHFRRSDGVGSRDPRDALSTVLTSLVDQETGQREFVMTGQEHFLEPYRQGRQGVDQAIADLRWTRGMALVAGSGDTSATGAADCGGHSLATTRDTAMPRAPPASTSLG